MSEIHYFPRYSQPENVVTNNTLLLLLRLREYSRSKFENFIGELCGDYDIQLASSWLRFQQQKGTGESVVDGFIAQDSVKIAVETKLPEAFDFDQLERHLAVFKKEDQHKLLILLSPSPEAISKEQLARIVKRAEPDNIMVVPTSFEEIVAKAKECLSPHDEEMAALVDDYESFCSDFGLMPRDEYTLFVPPCGQSFEDNVKFRLYYCPAEWSRRRAQYLGVYKGKQVRAIGRLAKVVACNVDLIARRVTSLHDEAQTLTRDEVERIVAATEKARSRGWDIAAGHKFYLCDAMEETAFRKTTPGGIRGHRYFDLEAVLGGKVPKGLVELTERLRGRTWERPSISG